MTEKNENVALDVGSGNVFADLGLDKAPELKLKAAIAGEVNLILKQRGLNQSQAAQLLDVPQPKISALKNGKLRGFSLEKLLGFMVKLDRDVEIGFKKSPTNQSSHFFLRNEDERYPVSI